MSFKDIMKHPRTFSPASRHAPIKNNTRPARARQSTVTAPSAPSAAPDAGATAAPQNQGDATARGLQPSDAHPDLRREEWDFTQLASKDVLACWRWEFQREMYRTDENVRLAVDILRKDRPLNAQRLHADPSNKQTALPWLVDGHAHYPQSVWPETPYQGVDPEYRRRVPGVLKEDSPLEVVSTAGRVQEQPLEQVCLEKVVKGSGRLGKWTQWPAGAVYDSGIGTLHLIGSAIHREPIQIQCTVVALSMDWSRTDTELKASFAQFLQAHRGTDRVLPNPERRGREKSESLMRTELKALAALRLWRHYGSVEKAMTFTQKSRPSLSFYQNERDWSAAKQRVEEVVAHLFEYEEILSKQILGIPREPVAKRISFGHMGK
jgi:hypothetical protein